MQVERRELRQGLSPDARDDPDAHDALVPFVRLDLHRLLYAGGQPPVEILRHRHSAGVKVERDGTEAARRTVEGLGRFVLAARNLKLGWGEFPDGAEVIYLYDAGDDGFGYALNLAWPDGSEWGYVPFGG